MNATSTIAIVLAAMTVLGTVVPAAAADFKLFGWDVLGDVEAGYRQYIDRPSPTRRGKLEEYRDLPQGPFLEQLQLRFFRDDSAYLTELGGSKWGQEDQEYSLSTGRLGLWRFGFEWDQTPHVFSTTARFLATEPRPGQFELPATTRGLAFGELHNQAREQDISVRWDTLRLDLNLTPSPDWELGAKYMRIRKDGERPMSVPFASPGGNFYEVPGPIDHTIHDFRLRGGLVRENWQLIAGYNFSLFQNGLKTIVAPNPMSATSPGAGQISLEPDNHAHTVYLQGGVNLPMRTRVSAHVAYQLRLQNESFLPHTLLANPTLPAGFPAEALVLPRRSLDGMVGTTTVNLNATTRPWTPVTLSLRYRMFDHDSMSEEPVFPGHVIGENSFVVEDRRAHGFEYTRHNADLDARWRLLNTVALTTGVGWEYWRRNEHREVQNSHEGFGKVALDVTPLDWITLSLSYRPSFRRIDEYETFAHLAHTVVEETLADATLTGQSLLLRKYDEGERNRHRVAASLSLAPFDTLSVTLTGDYRIDDYLGGQFGLRDERAWSAGADFSWAPLERLTFFGGYVHEDIKQFMKSRFRPVAGGVALDISQFDWVSDIHDIVDTLYAGLKVALIPRVLDWSASASYAIAVGRMDNRNPGGDPTTAPAAVATAGNIADATARPWPTTQDVLIRLDTALRYHFHRNWTASLGYVFESFQKNDWRTEGLNPFVPGGSAGNTGIFLGNDSRNYAAHILGMTLAYHFR
jgi:MtrB/PioB family decaheme-associated outer membrane protein